MLEQSRILAGRYVQPIMNSPRPNMVVPKHLRIIDAFRESLSGTFGYLEPHLSFGFMSYSPSLGQYLG